MIEESKIELVKLNCNNNELAFLNKELDSK